MTDSVRLFLVAPANPDPLRFPDQLAEALNAAEVAAVLLFSAALQGEGAVALVRSVQAAGAAALVAEDTRLMGRVRADGVQIGTGFGDLGTAVETLRPGRIVGAGNIHSRDAAMQAGEIGADYLLFGRPHGDTHDDLHPKALDLAAWWAELMEIPCVLMAGRSASSIERAAASGVDFVGLHDFVWAHEGGPAEAMRAAAAAIGRSERRAA